MANLTDADKVLRNDTGKDIVTKLNNIATAIQTSGTTSLYVIADAFDSTSTYDVGDYVIYNGSLYKCTTAVSVAGAFDPSDWETVQVMDEIPDNVAGAIAMTQAQWDAIVDKAAWRNAHKNSYLVITDAPNLNPTASDIEYSSGVTVKQAIDSKADKTETLYQVGDTVSGIFYMSGFVGGNNIIYVMPQFKKALSDSINGLNITIQNDNKITIYRINGDILTTSATSTGVYGLANGFRININYPNNTFDNTLLGTPIYIACTLSITFT